MEKLLASRGKDRSGKVRIGCARDAESGDCPDPRTYYVEHIEELVRDMLVRQFAEPALFESFLSEYRLELERTRSTNSGAREELEERLKKVGDEIDRLTNLLARGIGDVDRIDLQIKERLPKEAALRIQIKAMGEPMAEVRLHPAAIDAYQRALQELKISFSDGTSEPARLIRDLIERIIVHPDKTARAGAKSAPKIQIVGKLESLLLSSPPRLQLPRGVVRADPLVRGAGGSGGGT